MRALEGEVSVQEEIVEALGGDIFCTAGGRWASQLRPSRVSNKELDSTCGSTSS